MVLLEVKSMDEFATLGAFRPEIVREVVVTFFSAERRFLEESHSVVGGRIVD